MLDIIITINHNNNNRNSHPSSKSTELPIVQRDFFFEFIFSFGMHS
jgi:hypothetical protein